MKTTPKVINLAGLFQEYGKGEVIMAHSVVNVLTLLSAVFAVSSVLRVILAIYTQDSLSLLPT